MAYHIKDTVDSISEEVLGITRKLPEATRSSWCGESAYLAGAEVAADCYAS